MAKLLASKNNNLTLVARDKDKLEKAVASLHGKGHQIIVTDLSNRGEVDGLKEIIAINRYDVLINNAGVWNVREVFGDAIRGPG